MGRYYKIIDATEDEVFKAKETALSIVEENNFLKQVDELFHSEDLGYVENGIKGLNEMSSKSWLLSAILLYTLIYTRRLYEKSGLSWQKYNIEARARLGIDEREMSEQLSAARFFIKYHGSLVRRGWKPVGSNSKLCNAERALDLSGNIDDVLDHLVNDTTREFKDWYLGLRNPKKLQGPQSELMRNDITFKDGKPCINGIEAVKIATEIPESDRERLSKYMVQIFEALQGGYEPAIVPVYDEKEAAVLPRLRDKYRQKR